MTYYEKFLIPIALAVIFGTSALIREVVVTNRDATRELAMRFSWIQENQVKILDRMAASELRQFEQEKELALLRAKLE